MLFFRCFLSSFFYAGHSLSPVSHVCVKRGHGKDMRAVLRLFEGVQSKPNEVFPNSVVLTCFFSDLFYDNTISSLFHNNRSRSYFSLVYVGVQR